MKCDFKYKKYLVRRNLSFYKFKMEKCKKKARNDKFNYMDTQLVIYRLICILNTHLIFEKNKSVLKRKKCQIYME